jgi:outer membrane usher protein
MEPATKKKKLPVATCMFASAVLAWCLPACALDSSTLKEAVLDVQLNGVSAGRTLVVLRDEAGSVWIEETDLESLRLRTPSGAMLNKDGHRYVSLQEIPGSSFSIDEAQQSIALKLPPQAFTATTQSAAQRTGPSLTAADWGAFTNYQVYGERNDFESLGGAFNELGIFSPHGVLTNTLVGSYLSDSSRGVRLETTFRRDFPQSMHTVRIGDAISSPGSWGSALRFGGIQWGTNYATRPDLITVPLLSAAGEAVVPSTVDVFINNQQVNSTQVPSGPFVIDRLPAITGAGNVRLVVRDALGREQLVTVPFYSASTLLQAGLQQYSLEFGAAREDFAQSSFHYGKPVANAGYRRGFSDWLTIEARGEALLDGPRAAGLNTATRIGRLGVLDTTAAFGGDAEGSGWMASLGLDRSGERFSFAIRSQHASQGFRQVSDVSVLARPRIRNFAQTGVNLGRAGSLSLAVAHESYRQLPSRRVATIAHSISIGDWGFLSLSASRTQSEARSTDAFLLFTVPLANARNASLIARSTEHLGESSSEVAGTLQQSPPIGDGYGYRVTASTTRNYDASWQAQYPNLALEVQAARYGELEAQRATVTGGAALIGGYVATTRAVQDSFALVDVAGVPDLTVYVDNQPIARTDANGYALIRNLRPFEENRISVDPAQLPLDTTIGARVLAVAPAFRSGSRLRFPVDRQRGATFRLVRTDGSAVPSGAEVIIQSQRFPVAMDGLVYVANLDHGLAAIAEWNNERCAFRLPPPPSDDALPDLGTITCTSR